MYHYRRTIRKLAAYPKPQSCEFCDTQAMRIKMVYESTYCYVIPNRVFYNVWELRDVVDHLLLIPKAHVKSLEELSDEAKLDIMNTMARYEKHFYNIYARAPKSITRSVEHQHTHLIKAADKMGKGAIIFRKPYVFIKIK